MGQFGDKVLLMQKRFPNFKKSQLGQNSNDSLTLDKGKKILQQEPENSRYEKAKPKYQIQDADKRSYFSFELEGTLYKIGDTVLVSPVEIENPHVAVIKGITEDGDGDAIVTGQWFYRPKEAENKRGGKWEARDTRELFYSFHLDEFPADCVMHHCVVHFVPRHMQLPNRSKHPGFIVQRVYDAINKNLWELTDNYDDNTRRHEIDVLIQRTIEQLEDLPDIVSSDSSSYQDCQQKIKWKPKRKEMCSDVSKYHAILEKYKVLTGNGCRDKWLERLLEGMELVLNSESAVSTEDKQEAGDENCWLDVVISVISSLERATYETFIDRHKYKQKMRQLDFNLKNNALLAKRLLDKEFDPEAILAMSPDELKVGMTAEEMEESDEDDSEQMQMTDTRCPQCTEKKVGIEKYIQAGGRGDRYQLVCVACGHTWYAARDAIF